MSHLTHLPDIRIMYHCRSIAAIDYCFRYYQSTDSVPKEKLEKLETYRQNYIAELERLISQDQTPKLNLAELLNHL